LRSTLSSLAVSAAKTVNETPRLRAASHALAEVSGRRAHQAAVEDPRGGEIFRAATLERATGLTDSTLSTVSTQGDRSALARVLRRIPKDGVDQRGGLWNAIDLDRGVGFPLCGRGPG